MSFRIISAGLTRLFSHQSTAKTSQQAERQFKIFALAQCGLFMLMGLKIKYDSDRIQHSIAEIKEASRFKYRPRPDHWKIPFSEIDDH